MSSRLVTERHLRQVVGAKLKNSRTRRRRRRSNKPRGISIHSSIRMPSAFGISFAGNRLRDRLSTCHAGSGSSAAVPTSGIMISGVRVVFLPFEHEIAAPRSHCTCISRIFRALRDC